MSILIVNLSLKQLFGVNIPHQLRIGLNSENTHQPASSLPRLKPCIAQQEQHNFPMLQPIKMTVNEITQATLRSQDGCYSKAMVITKKKEKKSPEFMLRVF